MTYTVPAPAAPAKTRYTVVTDPGEILAIQRGGLADPIGHQFGGQWFAEVGSLAAYRESRASPASAVALTPRENDDAR